VLAFRGACGEPSCRFAPLEVSPVPLIPQDKEGCGSDTSHEENMIFIFKESRLLHSNQLVNEDKNELKTTIFKRLSFCFEKISYKGHLLVIRIVVEEMVNANRRRIFRWGN
jgi:hypothetical protein